MKRILKREYTAEFREQAVAMVNNGRSVPEVAEELGLIAQTLRNWVKAAERGRLNEKAKKVTDAQMELSRLRAENARLKMENEILKRRRRTSRRTGCEVRLDRAARARVAGGEAVSWAGCKRQWFQGVA
jgi:transposase